MGEVKVPSKRSGTVRGHIWGHIWGCFCLPRACRGDPVQFQPRGDSSCSQLTKGVRSMVPYQLVILSKHKAVKEEAAKFRNSASFLGKLLSGVRGSKPPWDWSPAAARQEGRDSSTRWTTASFQASQHRVLLPPSPQAPRGAKPSWECSRRRQNPPPPSHPPGLPLHSNYRGLRGFHTQSSEACVF